MLTKQECRERLERMLAAVKWNLQDPRIIGFWNERAKCRTEEEAKIFERLTEAWDELTAPKNVFDIFGV